VLNYNLRQLLWTWEWLTTKSEDNVEQGDSTVVEYTANPEQPNTMQQISKKVQVGKPNRHGHHLAN
jgi:hypothetical protein